METVTLPFTTVYLEKSVGSQSNHFPLEVMAHHPNPTSQQQKKQPELLLEQLGLGRVGGGLAMVSLPEIMAVDFVETPTGKKKSAFLKFGSFHKHIFRSHLLDLVGGEHGI